MESKRWNGSVFPSFFFLSSCFTHCPFFHVSGNKSSGIPSPMIYNFRFFYWLLCVVNVGGHWTHAKHLTGRLTWNPSKRTSPLTQTFPWTPFLDPSFAPVPLSLLALLLLTSSTWKHYYRTISLTLTSFSNSTPLPVIFYADTSLC